MLRSASVSLTFAVLGCGTAAGLCGCFEDECLETLACGDPPGPPARACNADPASGTAEDGCGVFVSASLGAGPWRPFPRGRGWIDDPRLTPAESWGKGGWAANRP